MKHFALIITICLIVVGINHAQDTGKPVTKSEEYSGRLPNNFRRVGLFDKQKQEIYKIQTQYRDKIAELERQLNALELERDIKVYNVLDPRQKVYLKELIGNDSGDYFVDVIKAAEKQAEKPADEGEEKPPAEE